MNGFRCVCIYVPKLFAKYLGLSRFTRLVTRKLEKIIKLMIKLVTQLNFEKINETD